MATYCQIVIHIILCSVLEKDTKNWSLSDDCGACLNIRPENIFKWFIAQASTYVLGDVNFRKTLQVSWT